MYRTAVSILVLTVAVCLSPRAGAAPKAEKAPVPEAKPTAKPATAKPAAEKPAVVKVTVVSVSGPAEKLPPGAPKKWQPLAAGDVLDELTVIRTGLRAKVVLKFDDRGEVTINNATKMGIGEFRKTGRLVKARIGLKYGTIRANVESAPGPNDFKVATPVATLSVRGTSGDVAYMGDTGLGMRGTSGTWRVVSGTRRRNVRAGEFTNGALARSIQLTMQHRDTRMGDAFGGLTRIEQVNLRTFSAGRGIIGFVGTRISVPLQIDPTPSLGRITISNGENDQRKDVAQ